MKKPSLVTKLAVLLVLTLLGIALCRHSSGSPAGGHQHQHGTPDHWPPVVPKPGSHAAPAA